LPVLFDLARDPFFMDSTYMFFLQLIQALSFQTFKCCK
jgi:hypothetical protein